jgi:hypothetical protein
MTPNEDAEFVITCCCCCHRRQAQERNNIRVPLKQQHGGRYTRTGSTTAAHGNTPGEECPFLEVGCSMLYHGTIWRHSAGCSQRTGSTTAAHGNTPGEGVSMFVECCPSVDVFFLQLLLQG